MDMSKYKQLKEKNALTLQRLGKGAFQLITPQFDPSTGEELYPEVTQCNPSGVDNAIKQLEEAIVQQNTALESLKILKADMEALEKNKTKPA